MHTCKALAENVLFIQRDPALEKTSCIFHTYPAHICILSCLVLTVQFSKIYFFFNISLGLAQSLLHAFTIFSWPAKQCNPPPPPICGSYSVNTNTGIATVICWLVSSFYSVWMPGFSHWGSITGPEQTGHQNHENGHCDGLLAFSTLRG